MLDDIQLLSSVSPKLNDNSSEVLYYDEGSQFVSLTYNEGKVDFIPVIKVYHHIVCKKCGKESTFLVSEYPSCYYQLHMVEKQLQEKGIQNYEDILADAVADTKEAVTVS